MSNRIFTLEQEEYLKVICEGKFNKEVVFLINDKFGTNFSEPQISRTKYRLGLKAGYLKQPPNSGQFKKGKKPIYILPKGSRISPATEFKKGNKPYNWKPLGSERICSKDGYILVKVLDGHLQKNWKAKHKIIWEEHNGPIPKGNAVIFLDTDVTNINIDNLALVSRAQLLLLNRQKLIKEDAALTKSGVLVAKVQEKIQKLNTGGQR